MKPKPTDLPDISDRADLVKLVDAFYAKVRGDQHLGHIFDGVAKVHWESHLPKLYDFWDTVLFRAGNFRGNLIGAHSRLASLTDMGRPLFDRCLQLFRETVRQRYAGERADHIVRCAEDMANVIHSKVHAIPDPRLDPGRLTHEQRSRYAAYRRDESHAG
jgi:hemoglobin